MAYNNQEQPDYVDSLEPGYHFCPTDVELIVYYLKPKIDTGIRHPNMRYYEVNLYEYGPDELTAKPEYRSCENKWYFLTPRERKHPNGNRPNRKDKNGGTWKATQKAKPQFDNMRRVVGSKTCLSYIDKKFNKTAWLMQEYTTDNPNIPRGSHELKEDANKLTEWVLCKIYKKERNPGNNNFRYHEEAIENQQLQDEPSPRRRGLSWNQESNQLNGAEHVPVQQSVGNSTLEYYQNQSRPMFTNGFHFSCGASSSSSSKLSPLAIVEPGDDDMAVPLEEDSNLAPLDDLLMTPPAQELADQMNTSPNPTTMQQIVYSQTILDELHQQHDQNSDDDTQSFFDELMIVHKNDYSYLEKLMAFDSEDA